MNHTKNIILFGLYILILVNKGVKNLHFLNFSYPEMCYETVGCFSIGYPWNYTSRKSFPPYQPENVLKEVIFYNPDVKNVSFEIFPEINRTVTEEFNRKYSTYFLAHGFTGSGYNSWLHETATKLLDKNPANVFIINWERGAKVKDYPQAIGNNRMAARIISIFIKHLVKEKDANLLDFYLIGHSLGGHLVCYIGKELNGEIGWIYSLDPAGPLYDNQPEEIRCSNKDAKYVAVLHTNIGKGQYGYGYSRPLGSVDYYFNDGIRQPCNFSETKLCSHMVVTTYFMSIVERKDACFIGYPFTYSDASEFMVSPQGAEKIIFRSKNVTGVYQIKTTAEPPFCNV